MIYNTLGLNLMRDAHIFDRSVRHPDVFLHPAGDALAVSTLDLGSAGREEPKVPALKL